MSNKDTDDFDFRAGADATDNEADDAVGDRGDEFVAGDPADGDGPEIERPETGDDAADADASGTGDRAGDDEPEEPEQPDASDTPEEPEPEPEPEPDFKDIRIPKKRFDQVNGKLKEAQARIKELEARQVKPDADQLSEDDQAALNYDFEKAETDYQQALLDGDTDKATQLRRDIRANERRVARVEAVDAVRRQQAKVEVEEARVELEATYDEFNPKSEGFSQELTSEVLAIYQGLLNRYSPGAALRKAAHTVAVMNGLTGLADDLQEAPAPQKPAAPAAKKTDVKAKAKAANQQPPQLGGNANKSEKAYDINQMSEDEFDALPAATKARLRGDIF